MINFIKLNLFFYFWIIKNIYLIRLKTIDFKLFIYISGFLIFK